MGKKRPHVDEATNVNLLRTDKISKKGSIQKIISQELLKKGSLQTIISQKQPKKGSLQEIVSQEPPKKGSLQKIVSQEPPKKGSLQKIVSQEPPKKKKKKDKEKNKHGTYKKRDSIEPIENVVSLLKEETEESKKKKMHIERIQESMQRPKMFLNQSDQTAVTISDVQDLIQFACLGVVSSAHLKWCKLLRVGKLCKVVVVIVSGVNDRCFSQYNHCFTNIQQLFNVSVKVHPVADKSIFHNLLFLKWRLSRFKKEVHISKLLEKEPNIPTLNENDDASDEEDFADSNLKRSDYVLTEEQMRWHGYPTADTPDFISTNHAEEISNDSPLLAIDCEMSMTHNGQELTRVSVVNERLEVLYETLVKPYNKIVDYLTRYSGITKMLLDPVKTRLEDVQQKLISLIPPDAILVGQSLNGDLKALKMYHPHCIDTSALFTKHYRVGLKTLAKHYLKRDIQCSEMGHDSTEDAQATMDLFLLKLRKGSKLADFNGRRNRELPVESIFQRVACEKKKSALVDVASNMKKFYKEPVSCITAMTDAETKKKMKQAVKDDNYDLVCGHLHSFKIVMDGISHEQHIIESTLANIDKRVGDIYAAVPNNSLCVVLLASATQGVNMDMDNTEVDLYSRCFAGIKYENEPSLKEPE